VPKTCDVGLDSSRSSITGSLLDPSEPKEGAVPAGWPKTDGPSDVEGAEAPNKDAAGGFLKMLVVEPNADPPKTELAAFDGVGFGPPNVVTPEPNPPCPPNSVFFAAGCRSASLINDEGNPTPASDPVPTCPKSRLKPAGGLCSPKPAKDDEGRPSRGFEPWTWPCWAPKTDECDGWWARTLGTADAPKIDGLAPSGG
jgi:hypothetical protein